MNQQKPNRKRDRLSGLELKASTLGWEISIPIIGGPLLGVWIDGLRRTAPRYTLIFLMLGILTGVYFLVRYIVAEYREMKREEEEQKEDHVSYYDPYDSL